jgi:hypothetical protein
MDGVSGSAGASNFQCVDSAVNAAGANAACVGAVAGMVMASPTVVGSAVLGVVAAVTCGAGAWNTAKAVDVCTADGDSGGMGPHTGSDGMEDHRNDPANAPWRSRVEIESLNEGEQDFVVHDSSY